ncbi:MAG: FHA domain-containing protein [bacterium]
MIILNGEKRGEQCDVGRSSLTIGRGASCSIQLPDPDIGEIHAEITPVDNALRITALGGTNLLIVNKSEVKEALLKHGDVVEIGATRLFIQSYANAGTRNGLTGFRKWRMGLTVGFPVLLLTGIILTVTRCHPKPPQPPSPRPPPLPVRALFSADTNSGDWAVTNIPQIQIHPSIVLTSNPVDVVDAVETFSHVNMSNSELEIAHGLREIESATHFLLEAQAREMARQTDGVPGLVTNVAPTNPPDNLNP